MVAAVEVSSITSIHFQFQLMIALYFAGGEQNNPGRGGGNQNRGGRGGGGNYPQNEQCWLLLVADEISVVTE